MSVLLGLSLVIGTASISFAADEKKEDVKKEAKKGKKGGKKATDAKKAEDKK
jgi:hypothetical protein